jgi:hypothetical protein
MGAMEAGSLPGQEQFIQDFGEFILPAVLQREVTHA